MIWALWRRAAGTGRPRPPAPSPRSLHPGRTSEARPAAPDRPAGPDRPDRPADPDRPIHFSSSKGSPRRWTVAQSLGSDARRPLWQVLPLSLSVMGLLLWCFLREETEADLWLTRVLEGSPLLPPDGDPPAGPGPGAGT
ncbi:protein CCSMST1 [Ornithorhynchus anatinus]|uniref:protein CCSMST1 n=1 Tax=Ornithorhynchus anatinus TaxID=9258 RepID=UPI0010A7A602|nr:protein CCSMST1 [Ornithorhynchus anatinus]